MNLAIPRQMFDAKFNSDQTRISQNPKNLPWTITRRDSRKYFKVWNVIKIPESPYTTRTSMNLAIPRWMFDAKFKGNPDCCVSKDHKLGVKKEDWITSCEYFLAILLLITSDPSLLRASRFLKPQVRWDVTSWIQRHLFTFLISDLKKVKRFVTAIDFFCSCPHYMFSPPREFLFPAPLKVLRNVKKSDEEPLLYFWMVYPNRWKLVCQFRIIVVTYACLSFQKKQCPELPVTQYLRLKGLLINSVGKN